MLRLKRDLAAASSFKRTIEYGDWSNQRILFQVHARQRSILAQNVKTYAFSVEEKLDIDFCKHSQGLYLRLAKGLMDLYKPNEKIH